MATYTQIKLVGPDKSPLARVVRTDLVNVAPSNTKEVSDRNAVRNVWSPVLLAGPIVRRVEPAKVWIWLATSIPVEVEARLGLPAQVELWRSPMGVGKSSSRQAGPPVAHHAGQD